MWAVKQPLQKLWAPHNAVTGSFIVSWQIAHSMFSVIVEDIVLLQGGDPHDVKFFTSVFCVLAL